MRFKEYYLTEAPIYTDTYVQSSNFVIHGRYDKAIKERKKFKEIIYDKYKILRTTGYTKTSIEWFVFIDDILVANFSSELGLNLFLELYEMVIYFYMMIVEDFVL